MEKAATNQLGINIDVWCKNGEFIKKLQRIIIKRLVYMESWELTTSPVITECIIYTYMLYIF